VKTIKPQRLSVLHRTFDNDGKSFFVPSVLVFFGFEAPDVPLHEVNLWKLIGEELGGEAALDECMKKAQGELIVTGRAYPRGGPQPACAVRLTLGRIHKELYVVGDRHWRRGVATDPEPFEEMPIAWSRAFGGEGFEKNPLGKGAAPVRDAKTGEAVHALPNVENPKRLVRAPGDRPEPVGFGPIDMTWPQRAKKRGTYDNAWLEKRFPGFPDDLDWTFFNVAPPDQWLEGLFEGGEPFELVNLHPSASTQSSRLPRLSPRCFITRTGVEGLEEVPLGLDTVHLFPHRGRGVCFYRGLVQVREDDASDVAVLVAACERPGEPRPISHYAEVVARRLDHAKAHLYLLRDSDLIFERDPESPPLDHETLALDDHAMADFPLAANMRRRTERELEKARQKVIEMGLDPDQMGLPEELPPPEEMPPLDRIGEFVEQKLLLAEEQRQKADEEREAAVARARASCEAAGIDYDAVVAEQQKKQGGPPKFSAAEEMERLEAQAELARNAGVRLPEVEKQLADDTLWERLQKAEAALYLTYRRYGHLFPAASRLEGDAASRIREEVVRARAESESLAGRDLTGADLSGLDLCGADFEGAFLEAADLTDARLDGANLVDAVLARADLSRASLRGARLLRTNFGEARLHEVDLSGGIDLTGAVFGKAILERANLSDALLDGVDWMGASFVDCDLSRTQGSGVLFYENDLSTVSFVGAVLKSCLFFRVTARGTNFAKATLDESTFVTAQCEGAKLDGVTGINLRVVERSSLAGASLKGAKLERACLRGTNFARADFSGAELSGADLSDTDLTEAAFYRARAPQALFIKANLTGASLLGIDLREAFCSKADLRGADLRGSNLFRADFARVHRDRATRFDGANMKRIRFVKRADEPA
jgi:uncharacterized protein YjbI with pentapeptide repeats